MQGSSESNLFLFSFHVNPWVLYQNLQLLIFYHFLRQPTFFSCWLILNEHSYWAAKELLWQVTEWVFVQVISRLGTSWGAGKPISLPMALSVQISRCHDFSQFFLSSGGLTMFLKENDALRTLKTRLHNACVNLILSHQPAVWPMGWGWTRP